MKSQHLALRCKLLYLICGVLPNIERDRLLSLIKSREAHFESVCCLDVGGVSCRIELVEKSVLAIVDCDVDVLRIDACNIVGYSLLVEVGVEVETEGLLVCKNVEGIGEYDGKAEYSQEVQIHKIL